MRKNNLAYGKGVKDYWGKVIYKSENPNGTHEIHMFTPNEWNDIKCMAYQDTQNKQKTGYEYK